MPKTPVLSDQAEQASPDYTGLVQFLVQPFLESPKSLSVDCEQFNQNRRVWIRMAFKGADKGRVYGRGGRNIQAIRRVLETAAAAAGQSLYLDIYENYSNRSVRLKNDDSGKKQERRRPRPSNSALPKPSVKPRS